MKVSLLYSPGRGANPTTSRTHKLHNKQGVPHPTRSAIGRRCPRPRLELYGCLEKEKKSLFLADIYALNKSLPVLIWLRFRNNGTKVLVLLYRKKVTLNETSAYINQEIVSWFRGILCDHCHDKMGASKRWILFYKHRGLCINNTQFPRIIYSLSRAIARILSRGRRMWQKEVPKAPITYR